VATWRFYESVVSFPFFRKDQLEAASRYVSDRELPSSHHHVGTEGPVLYGVGTLGSMLVMSLSLGLTAVADYLIPLPFYVNLLKDNSIVIIATATW